MSCEICGRNSCTRSFHSIREQEEFDKSEEDLKEEFEQLRTENERLRNEVDKIKFEVWQAYEYYKREGLLNIGNIIEYAESFKRMKDIVKAARGIYEDLQKVLEDK